MSKSFWVMIAVVVVATAIYYPFSPGGRQRTNMNRAQRHIPALQTLIANDPRFANIQMGTFTGNGGSLMIRGEVASERDAEALKSIVERSNPPSPVAFRVLTQPVSTTQPSE